MMNSEMIVASLGLIIAVGSLWYSRKAVEIAKHGTTIEAEKVSRDRSARMEMVEPLTGINYGSSSADTLAYQVAFHNEGKADAINFTVSLFFHQTAIRSHGTTATHSVDQVTGELKDIPYPHLMPAGSIWIFRFQVRRWDFGENSPRKISVLLSWRDDTGERSARWAMIYSGELKAGHHGSASPAEVLVDRKVVRPRNPTLEESVSIHSNYEVED